MVLTGRILILIGIVLVLGGPYSIFILMEVFSIAHAPSYSHRIGFMCISIAAALSIITIIYFTRPIREKLEKYLVIPKQLQNSRKTEPLKNLKEIEINAEIIQQDGTEESQT